MITQDRNKCTKRYTLGYIFTNKINCVANIYKKNKIKIHRDKLISNSEVFYCDIMKAVKLSLL